MGISSRSGSMQAAGSRTRSPDEVAWYRLSQANRALGNTEEQKKTLAGFQRLRSQLASQQGTTTPGEVTRQVRAER